MGCRLLARLLRRRDGSVGAPEPSASPGLMGAAGTGEEAAVAQAVRDLVVAPDDMDLQVMLRVAVRRLLAVDAVLMADLAQMVQQHAPTQQAGHRSIQIAGDQSGGWNVTGDGNKISCRDSGLA